MDMRSKKTGDKIFQDTGGQMDEYEGSTEKRTHIRFPVCLDVSWGGSLIGECLDFSMNISRGGVFVQTSSPLPIGSKVDIVFYIPPESKLLCDCRGVVVEINTDTRLYVAGMHVKFTEYTDESMKMLVDYLEERKHLVDEEA